jgi:hypothetical protein
VADSIENNNEFLGPVKGREFPRYLDDYWFPKDYATGS